MIRGYPNWVTSAERSGRGVFVARGVRQTIVESPRASFDLYDYYTTRGAFGLGWPNVSEVCVRVRIDFRFAFAPITLYTREIAPLAPHKSDINSRQGIPRRTVNTRSAPFAQIFPELLLPAPPPSSAVGSTSGSEHDADG